MRVAVLGTGLIGSTVVRELTSSRFITEVVAVDGQQESLDRALSSIGSPGVKGRLVDLGRPEAVKSFLQDFDVAVAALPHSLSFMVNEAAVAAGCHLVDLVGSQYPEKLAALDAAARANDVLLVTGCGVAPGIVNVLAARGIELLDTADEA